MNESYRAPRIKFLGKVHTRIHFCREAAIVRIDDGLGRIKIVGNKDSDLGSLCVDGHILAEGEPTGCPTCAVRLRHGYGEGLMSLEECLRVEDSINGDYAGIEDMIHRMKPLLGLFSSGYYLLADMDQFAHLTECNYSDDFIVGESDFHYGIRNWHNIYEFTIHNSPLCLWATQRPQTMNWGRVEYYMERLSNNATTAPRAIAFYANGSISFILDGHHKAAAASMLGRRVPCVVIFKVASCDKTISSTIENEMKLSLNSCGTYFERDQHDEGKFVYSVPIRMQLQLKDRNENTLQKISALMDPEMSADEFEENWSSWRENLYNDDSDCDFLQKYNPPAGVFTLSELEAGTRICLSRIRETLANIRLAMEQFARNREYPDDIELIIRDLLAYHHLFPDSKWLEPKDVDDLQRFIKLFDNRSAWINLPPWSNDGIYSKNRITADRNELAVLDEIKDEFRPIGDV